MKPWFVRSILALVLLTGMYLPASAALLPPGDTCTWTGAADNNWHNPANWTCGHVPGPNDSIIVAMGGAPSYIHDPATAGSVTVNPGATLGLDPNQSLTVGAGFTLGQNTELMLGPNSTITLQSGDWTDNNAFIPGSGPWTLILDGQGNQAITGAKPTQSFSNVHLRNMNMGLPVFNTGPNVQQLNVGGTLTLGGDTTFDAGSTAVQVGGDWLNNGATFLGSGGVTFTGGNDQLIGGSAPNQTFPGPVTVNKSGGTLTLGPAVNGVTVNGPLAISGGTLRLGSKHLSTSGTTTVGPGTLDFGDGSLWTAQGTFTLNSGGTFASTRGTVQLDGGDWTNNGGTVVNTTPWTLQFNGATNQTINGTATTQTFGNLTLANPGMSLPVVQVGGSTTQVHIGGALTLGADTTFNTGPAGVQIEGDWLNNGGTHQGSGGVIFAGGNDQLIGGTAPSQTFPGDLTLTKTGGGVALGGSTTQLNVNGALNVYGGTLQLGGGRLNTGGPATIRQTGTLNLGTGTWNSGACVYLQTGGTLAPGSGTLNFQGGTFGLIGGTLGSGNWTANFNMQGPQEIGGFGVPVFHNVGIYNATMGGPAPVLRVGDFRGGGPSGVVFGGTVTIGENAGFNAGSASHIYVGGPGWENNGTYTPGQATVIFVGSGSDAGARSLAATQVITGASPTTFHGLTIDNPAGVTLGASQAVSGALYLKAGDLTTNAFTLTLGSGATVTGTRDVVGTVARTHVFTPGVPFSFNHRFASLTFADPGALTGVAMTMQKAAPVGLTPAVTRTYTITPSGGGYTATLRLAYQDAELGGLTEAGLRLWRWAAGAWSLLGRSAGDAAANWVEQAGVTDFSAWALAPEETSPTRRIYLPLIQRQ
jgi:hypothetical protein